MIPRLLALLRAEAHLIDRLEQLAPRLDGGDSACWAEYAAIASALAALAPQLTPERMAEVLSQKELAERFGVSLRTVRRRVQNGTLPTKRPAIRKTEAAR